MRLLVCGGRTYADRQFLFDTLDRVRDKVEVWCVIVGGKKKGADGLAYEWAVARGIPVDLYEADWDGLGLSAGPVRNERMLKEGKPNGVVAFPGGSGTAHMVAIAKKAGIKVWLPLNPRE